MQQRLPEPAPDRAADIAACRALLRTGSRTFYAASFLLPRRVREPASALYAFCRLADDSVDCDGGRLAAIAPLRQRLDGAYRGRPRSHPADRALAEVVSRFNMPRELPEALLSGLEWDARGRTYDDLDDLHDYCVRVAGSVGTMMAVLMGVRAPELLARACDLGCAMQLTNIARDIGEDARAGRIYMPLAWLRAAGIDPEGWLANPRFTRELAGVIARILRAADDLYERADAGIAGLPASCRPGIRAARLLYAEIGHELRRNGLNSVAHRAIVPAARKLRLLAQAAAPAFAGEAPTQPCLEQGQFLVDAGARHWAPMPERCGPKWWDLPRRWVRVIDLIEELERRDRSRSQSSGADAGDCIGV
jgi:15-cis-phytoene synthase